ncbi:lipid-binding SYLF domain-containing protein [Campylobacter suis]|uniref:Ysc84 actin-binding domain-containing protein n=1 Tax=Campylobacter suis TaxID=2790657 RepID=A0ABN7K880_9BACT|nr:lipid-binding SYLF domain-containing protein [Campylobacter suis]CAD7287095.1 hypothetical protein LMG8286_00726 [Campylobacter suis]
MKKILFILAFVVGLFGGEDLVLSSANSYQMVLRANPNAPTNALIKQSKAVIIFPSVKKIGFLVGGMGGNGVMITPVNSNEKEMYSVGISGGSFGLQVGYEDSSLVLFVLDENLVNDIKNGKFTIQADASFSFGDGGRAYNKTSDFKFTSSIYAYATNAGFFAGASFGGAVISHNDENLLQSGYAFEQLQNSLTNN